MELLYQGSPGAAESNFRSSCQSLQRHYHYRRRRVPRPGRLGTKCRVFRAYQPATFMNSPDVRNAIQIDRGLTSAISDEIGYRLRIKLASELDPLPQQLVTLIDQIAQISRHSSQTSEVTK